MGLDIYLLKPLKEPRVKGDWLSVDGNPLLMRYFSSYLTVCPTPDHGDATYQQVGFYYREISYQRKGVIKGFVERFGPDDLIVTQKGLVALKGYIDSRHLDSFELDFCQKFIEGEHFIMISY